MEWYEKRRFGDLADDVADKFGKREALIFGRNRYSFSQQAREIDNAAKGLIAIGVEKGDHVALWLSNCDNWIFIAFAVVKIGAVLVPINTRFRINDLDYVLRQSDSKFLITHDTSGPIDYLSMVRDVVSLPINGNLIQDPNIQKLKHVLILGNSEPEGVMSWTSVLEAGKGITDKDLSDRADSVDPDDPVFIMYTSGTTGFPKGVVHSHKLVRNVEDRAFRLAISPNDVILNYLPLFHAFGYSEGALTAMVSGACQVVTESFNPDECLDLVVHEGVTIIHGFEAHLHGLTKAQEANPRNLSTLRTGLFAAGMHSATPVVRRGNEVLTPLKSVSGYGMTEVWVGAGIGSLDDDLKYRCESSGDVGLGYQMRVVDLETGLPQGPGKPGELQVKGYSLMLGYYNNPEETASAFDQEGWFKTGDTAVWLENGYIRLLGRYKDMLKVGGENVDPMEAEGLLLEHTEVHQVAVVGAPDVRLSEIPIAYVRLTPGSSLSADAIINYCRGKLASFKIPQKVVFVEELPMTASGKIRKIELREDAKQRFSL